MSTELQETVLKLTSLKPLVKGGVDSTGAQFLPESTKARFDKYGVDYSNGYPVAPDTSEIPVFVDEVLKVRNKEVPYIERGKNADPEKKALFGAAKEVIHLTKHIGTEIVGLQLSDLTDQQRDELALLIAERVVVYFRDQDLSPQKQLEIGQYFGPVEVHPQGGRVPLEHGGVHVIWMDQAKRKGFLKTSFKKTGGTAHWHTDLTHEFQPPGITHLHNDAIPNVGGDTVWVSGYAAFDKLSPAFQKFLEGKKAVYKSLHGYIDRENPLSGPKNIEREHPIIRTHPATGWKSLFVNRAYTTRIVGLEPRESDLILEYLFGVFEKNLDIQVRFNWKPTKAGLGTSALWDNRISQHYAIWDHEGEEPRHGTRVSSLAEVPYFDPGSKSQREALGLSLD
ncbi:alpha-ketoglutarate-dependent sulfonate dioxygenase [[Candida] anglica]|uniref:Alpha-ketoglutarate-dependent sulfonate dioxygenase n=1 Tax=[Candida] anglica TaxID=148631 RepID=A0ABP0ELW4_9ASCO